MTTKGMALALALVSLAALAAGAVQRAERAELAARLQRAQQEMDRRGAEIADLRHRMELLAVLCLGGRDVAR